MLLFQDGQEEPIRLVTTRNSCSLREGAPTSEPERQQEER